MTKTVPVLSSSSSCQWRRQMDSDNPVWAVLGKGEAQGAVEP